MTTAKSSAFGTMRPEPVVLLGLAPQGLFLLRELSRAGFDVYAVTVAKTVGYYSKYGKKVLVRSLAELRQVLLRFSSQFGAGTPCYVSSGAMLDAVVEHMPELYDIFEIYPRPLASVRAFCRKDSTYALARRLGIPLLETVPLHDALVEQTRNALAYPLLAKWNREFRLFDSRRFKTRLLYSGAELAEFARWLEQDEKEHVILQRYLATDQTHNVSYLGYFVKGDCILGLLAQQLRQYPPGVTSYVREYTGRHSDVVTEHAKSLFAETGYTGFGEAEFKLDRELERAYLLEVNPRTCGWTKALKTKYPSIREVLADRMSNRPLAASKDAVVWVNLLRDIRAIVAQAIERRSITAVLRGFLSYRQVGNLDIWDCRDLRPFFAQFTAFKRKNRK